jgi:hypothetical protein
MQGLLRRNVVSSVEDLETGYRGPPENALLVLALIE